MSFSKPSLARSFITTSTAQVDKAMQKPECKIVRTFAVLAFFLTLVILNQGFATPSAYAATLASSTSQISYNCSSYHCYGVTVWNGAPGASTNIYTNGIHGGNNFIDNEMWLVDGAYWTEAGVTDQPSRASGNLLFYADNRATWGYAEHFSNPLTSADYGKYMQVDLIKTNQGISVAIGGLPNTSLYDVSANFISPKQVQMGMELAGTSGASAPRNGFALNQWYNGSTWIYQGNNGTANQTNTPVNAYWTSYPSTPGSNGGQWTTCIYGAGC